jgi:3-oxoadipate enol-lactonase
MPFLKLHDGQIYYEEAGTGQALVLLHAGIAHSAMWDLQFEYFARTQRVVRYDQRGFGKTVTTTPHFNRRADLLAMLDHLKIKYGILMGCSMGGQIATDFALEHPDRVAALILIAPGLSGNQPDPSLASASEEQEAAYNAKDWERLIELELQMWVDGPKRTPDESDTAVRAKIREMELENLKINTDGYDSVQLDPPAFGRLHQIRVPTLIIIGDGDQPSLVTTASKLAREIPNAQLHEMQGVAHVPSMERAEEVNRAIEKFLESSD